MRFKQLMCIILLYILSSTTPSSILAQQNFENSLKRPNIILILADDLGYTDISPFGSEINTPNIARLAQEGISFTNYHTAGSCAPARAMLLTGVDSHRNGVPNIPVRHRDPLKYRHDFVKIMKNGQN